ncbi:signal peptidase I [Nakamurella sp. PAMC28650]|uniref:signal peptidase I n=1 Tax=Nakamurella sp. PAMC28650 TaxID=2762325 RepID=UPI00164D2E06|nr:signal peptidase I [Nakamurella sp. PAMC28650]QNK83592.1 signal peptidase I [Nakamurella sp. PAMC28650]
MVAGAALLLVVAAAVVVRSLWLDSVTVSSGSMAPTVCTGDLVLLVRMHGDEAARIDDIVTFPSPQDGGQVIKRVVAVAGQSVVIKDAQLFVDGRAVDEPYVDHASIDGVYTATVIVPDHSVFVMGDNRENSIDSRSYGPIPTSIIDGRMLWDMWHDCS